MLSLAEFKAGLCPICGYPKEICQAPENSTKFAASPPSRCHATAALRRFQKENEYEYPDSLIWSAQLKSEPQA